MTQRLAAVSAAREDFWRAVEMLPILDECLRGMTQEQIAEEISELDLGESGQTEVSSKHDARTAPSSLP